ncbi:hypothetical protein [Mycolicibacterium diernhoferi]|uniref:Uncharacterized protein n=1 Tax=Mycolicibacterium diernhoferi TaxID=1801 RepID=A0A1Q4H5D5_9MYCO|nr:hypothetical protein [Mycolicibacterium diernhoferi]OJZ62770.1 hypothetical protein BRW64_24925 [Mycolicibacterium diernhoferi]OPE48744.1 hypothetical protein BV510_23295 [Mycolicibacterium diernhoferi]PEG55405.1 hypothetical protein CRI78_05665 [Mycolicibacterium diernhoferi]QYL24324.1 hypothetical protein K0O62_08715 [Mycolicibacterium diernhoferi]
MSVTSRARSITRFGVKVQRRIVIVQALVWPTLIVTGAAVGTAAALAVRHRRDTAPWSPDAVPD